VREQGGGMTSPAQYLWRLMPAGFRSRLYHRIMSTFVHLHGFALDLMWRYGYLARRWVRPAPVDPANHRVLHLTGSFDLGGTQTQIKHLCTATGTRYTHHASEIFPELNYLYRQDAGIDVTRYTTGGLVARTVGRLVQNRNYRSSQLVQIYKLVRDFEAIRPAAAVGWGHEMCVTTFIAAAIARVPQIVFCIRTVRPEDWSGPDYSSMLLRAHRHMSSEASSITVNSTLLQADHADWAGIDPRSITVCPNGIEIAELTPEDAARARAEVRSAHGIPDDAIVIVNVGRFSAEKGQRSIVEANRLLLARGADRPFVWVMCGDGITLPEIQAAAAAQGMTNMIFLGRTTRVREVLAASDIFVMPSDFEGMPNAMMEAMAAGLPSVSTTRSGARDVARDGCEALYYEPRDHLQLARHLWRLMHDPDEAARMGRAAAARVREFSVPRFVAGFEAMLDATRPVS
jgi:glycosyltransferase involved in cell wall biosynthesis